MKERKEMNMDSFIDFLIDKVVLPELKKQGGKNDVKRTDDNRIDGLLSLPEEMVRQIN